MKTSTFDTARIKQTVNLIEVAGRDTELRKATAGEYHGPCPWCGGTDRFRVTSDRFACRQCGRKGDAIEYVMRRQNVDFKAAYSMLDGDLPMPVGEKVKPASKPVVSSYTWDEPKQRQAALDGHAALVAGKTKSAQAALDYLQGRCIDLGAVKAFKIGYKFIGLPGTWDDDKKTRSHPKQWAISLPWFNHDGVLMSVKYRFIESHTYTDIEGKERTENKTSRGPAAGHLFGWPALSGPDKCKVLIICEGEMNALSLWQAGQGDIDVLSAGSESTTTALPTPAIELARQYQHRIVWADKGAIADTAAVSIGAASMRSPISQAHPKGADANDLLKAGKLSALISGMLKRLGVDHELPPRGEVWQQRLAQCQAAGVDIDNQDITDFVGAIVDLPTLAAIQRRLELRGWHADIEELEGQRGKVKLLYSNNPPLVDGLQRIGASHPL